MSSTRNPAHGFTLIEMMIVVAVFGLLASLIAINISRQRPRATLASVTADLQGLIHGARQSALASGHDTIVMLFPERADQKPARVVVLEDPTFTFMAGGGALDFDGYDPEVLRYPDGGRVEHLDLPGDIEFGPATGMGSALPAPLDTINVLVPCSFCSADASRNLRGAIRFDARGAATFYDTNAVKRPSGNGASFTLTNPDLGQRNTFIILSSTGVVQVQQHY